MSTTVRLSNGQEMPLLGLGCSGASDEEIAAAVEMAVRAGYRHIDTAFVYGNERGVGDGIRRALEGGEVKRKELFVVTKLPAQGMRRGKVQEYLRKSLAALGLAFVDLYLVHSPVGAKESEEGDSRGLPKVLDFSTDIIAVWKDMEEMARQGLARSIGVSNFTAKQLLKIVSNAAIPPVVNQIECHAFFQQLDLRKASEKLGVAVTAYAPLGSPGRGARGTVLPDLLGCPVVRLVAARHARSPAQVLLRFLIQQGVIVIPKSTNERRIRENAGVFGWQLDDLDMEALRLQDRGEAGRMFRYADKVPRMREHPEFFQ